jgi:hypothetical protein
MCRCAGDQARMAGARRRGALVCGARACASVFVCVCVCVCVYVCAFVRGARVRVSVCVCVCGPRHTTTTDRNISAIVRGSRRKHTSIHRRSSSSETYTCRHVVSSTCRSVRRSLGSPQKRTRTIVPFSDEITHTPPRVSRVSRVSPQVDLSLCGARASNARPTAERDAALVGAYGAATCRGRSAVDLAELQMSAAGVRVVARFDGWPWQTRSGGVRRRPRSRLRRGGGGRRGSGGAR